MDEAIIRVLWRHLVLSGGWHPDVLLESLEDDLPLAAHAHLSAIVEDEPEGR